VQDAPGTWRKYADEEHKVPYYHNVDTQQSQYNVPPSCAWVKGFMEGSTLYTNTITHQAKWTLLKALAWKQLHNGETNTCGRCQQWCIAPGDAQWLLFASTRSGGAARKDNSNGVSRVPAL
jgi:hypothetical protein